MQMLLSFLRRTEQIGGYPLYLIEGFSRFSELPVVLLCTIRGIQVPQKRISTLFWGSLRRLEKRKSKELTESLRNYTIQVRQPSECLPDQDITKRKPPHWTALSDAPILYCENTDANPDRDTTEQFKMLNRAYEVLRDPKLRQSYDAFGTKGIGTSAASDIENIKRRQPKPSSSTTTRASSTWASESTARTNGYASDIGSNWATGAKASSTGAGQRRSTSFTDEATVDPFSVNKRAPYTPKKESSEWSSAAYQDPGFRPRPQATSTSASEYQSGTQSGDKSAYYGDMGSVHAQRGHGTRFEDKLFETDGVTSGEAFFGRGPKFGRDVLINVQLDTNITRAGGKKMIEVKHMESCSTCRGTGTKDSSSTVKGCRHCGGTGYTTGSSMMRETCPVCNGSGRIVTNPCKSCQGLGMQEATKSIEVNIPRNVDDGYTLRVPGEGDAGPNGGPSGDLYVCFKVKGAPAKAAAQKPTGTSAPEQSRVRARSSVMSRKPANKPSSGLAPDQSRASTSVRPASSAPPKRPSGLRPDNIKAGLKPPVQQRMGVERSNPQRVSSESVARSQPQRASANSSTSRNVVERSRVPPAQAQANRFGSTRVVPPNANSESDIQPRRGRLRGIRNFVSNILNR